MKVAQILPNVSFGRALKQEEIEEFKNTLKEGKKLSGQTGNSKKLLIILII